MSYIAPPGPSGRRPVALLQRKFDEIIYYSHDISTVKSFLHPMMMCTIKYVGLCF